MVGLGYVKVYVKKMKKTTLLNRPVGNQKSVSKSPKGPVTRFPLMKSQKR